MTVSSGFFNSKNHDRVYNAIQISSIFDGLITDGVYQGIGKAFLVKSQEELDSSIVVGTGRAWFNHTWTLNDSDYVINITKSNSMFSRIDAIVIDVNSEETTRANSIIVKEGSYSETPQKPTMIRGDLHNQYPLAYITVPAGSSGPILNSNIEIAVGTSECPLVTGILEVLTKDLFIQQFDAQFTEWFNGLKDQVGDNVAINLQNQIDSLNEKFNKSQATSLTTDQIEFSSKLPISIYEIDHHINAATYDMVVLPDGYVFVLHRGGSSGSYTGLNPGVTTDSNTLYATILDDNNLMTSTTITTPLYDGYYNSLALCNAKCDSYPVELYYSFYNSDGMHFIKISISSQHVVSKSSFVQTIAQEDDVKVRCSTSVPAFDPDGSVVVSACYYRYVSYANNGYYYYLYRLSKDWVVTKSSNFRIAYSTSHSSSDSSFMFRQDDGSYYLTMGRYRDYWGCLVNNDLTLASSLTGYDHADPTFDNVSGWNEGYAFVGNKLLSIKNMDVEQETYLPTSIDGFVSSDSKQYNSLIFSYYRSINESYFEKTYCDETGSSSSSYKYYIRVAKFLPTSKLLIWSDFIKLADDCGEDTSTLIHPYLSRYIESKKEYVSLYFPKFTIDFSKENSELFKDNRSAGGRIYRIKED